MAIPDNPIWSSLDTIGVYEHFGLDVPEQLAIKSALSMGPLILNDSQGKLNQAYWAVYQDSGKVYITQAVGLGWSVPVELFAEVDPINEFALSFDQLGRALVFYRVGEDELRLYWFNPVLGQNIKEVIATGVDPLAGFDFPQDTGQGFTDIMLFYVRADSVYMRVQRDRFQIEYATGVNKPGVRLESSGYRKDNRFQVIYLYPGD